MFSWLFLFFVSFCLFTGCVEQEAPPVEKTQVEVREFQTRTFDVKEYRLVMKSVLNVLQDDGYMVKNVALDLGFLSATKDIALANASDSFYEENDFGSFEFDIFASRSARSRVGIGKKRKSIPKPTHEVIEVTVNVSEFGDKVRVRASFQSKVFDNRERLLKVRQIEQDTFYFDFFAKIDKGLFLQQQNI